MAAITTPSMTAIHLSKSAFRSILFVFASTSDRRLASFVAAFVAASDCSIAAFVAASDCLIAAFIAASNRSLSAFVDDSNRSIAELNKVMFRLGCRLINRRQNRACRQRRFLIGSSGIHERIVNRLLIATTLRITTSLSTQWHINNHPNGSNHHPKHDRHPSEQIHL